MKKLILSLLLFLLLSACVEERAEISYENKVHDDQSDQFDGSIRSDKSDQSDESEFFDPPKKTSVEETILDQFIKKIQPDGLTLKTIIEDDINLDGNKEFILVFGEYEQIFVADAKFQVIGELMDSIPVAHENTDVKIMKLDRTDQKFIVLFSSQISMGGYGEGFTIYEWNGNQIEEVYANYPTATGTGIRTLEDYDGDGVFRPNRFPITLRNRFLV